MGTRLSIQQKCFGNFMVNASQGWSANLEMDTACLTLTTQIDLIGFIKLVYN